MSVLSLDLYVQSFGKDVVKYVVRYEEISIDYFVPGYDDVHVVGVEQAPSVSLRARNNVVKLFLHYFYAAQHF